MRILFFTDSYPPQVNGVSVVTALSVGGLRERGWTCAVVAPRPATPHDGIVDDALLTIPSLPLPGYPDVRVAVPRRRMLRAFVAAFSPDLVHCATEFVVGRAGARAADALGIPWSSSYHTDFARYARAYRVPWLAPSVERSLVGFHARSRRVFTPSLAAREDLRRMGVDHADVWGGGVDTKRFHPAHRSGALRRRHGLGDAFTILFVGRLAAEKGVEVVLDAFAALERTRPPGTVRLVIAGDGPRAGALGRRASATVRFVGPQDHLRDLPALYASADAFVTASTTETLGLTALEAMASGTPVVASLEGGINDVLRPGENGLAFEAASARDCASALERLIADPGLRRRLAAGARRTAEARSWEAELDRLDAHYRALVGGPRTAGPRVARPPVTPARAAT